MLTIDASINGSSSDRLLQETIYSGGLSHMRPLGYSKVGPWAKDAVRPPKISDWVSVT